VSGAPRLSITVAGLSSLFGDDLAGVVEVARAAERAGVHQVVVPDHLAMGPRTDRYPYGRYPLPPDEPYLEPLTTLAAIAGATERIRLGTGILIAPLRRPLVLAKTAATLDVLSRGRLDLGVGVGWQPEEFAAAGVPFAERWRRLDDALRACRVLWSEAPARFHSPTVSFEDLHCLPRPVQPGGIPIWFGVAPSERNLKRIAELGAGWLPMTSDLAQLRAGYDALREAFVRAGRDPGEARVRANAPLVRGADGRVDLDATLDALPALGAAGVDVAGFPLARFARSRDAIEPFFARLAAFSGGAA
jgi:probable F420-dependent oxidoreductase